MLTKQQTRILQASINIIIPSDGGPNGCEGGVDRYLFRQFERDLQHVVPLYQQGLDALDKEAQAVTGSVYVALDAEKQEQVLRHIEAGQVQTIWPIDPVDFFKMIIEHCAEGFYSDPGNGGNRDGVAWKMIGFEVSG